MREDARSPAILMYLEGINEGRRCFDLLRETTRRKPVIIWRGGRSRAGARAVRSHAASLASDDKIWDAVLRQCDAISAGTIHEALDALAALVHTRKPSGRGIALIATTGGQSVAITDQFERAAFEIPELSARSYERLSEFFVTIGGSYRNPFDAASTIGRETDNLRKILEILADDSAIDAGVAIEMGGRDTDQDNERLAAQLDLLNAYRDKTGLPVVVAMPNGGVISDGEGALIKTREAVQAKGFAVFPSFQRVGAALSRIVDYHARQASR
jgi:acyl-CoA synthetase (NDP forming)